MLLKLILITHRYLAVAIGLLMALWCLSGFVMMYQDYPSFTARERLESLAPLNLAGCCNTSFLPGDAEPASNFRIEMLRGEPVLRQRGVVPIRLASGTPIEALSQDDLREMAADYARQRGIADAAPEWLGEIGVDQWSIGAVRENQPLQHLALHDAAGSEIYINARAGAIVQETSRRERVLSWFGAIPHWLYPTVLRSNAPLWSQVVIWTSALGVFLTLTGMYVGIVRLRRRSKDGPLASPFRGWWYWHHVLGLVFGILTLTWVFSGLMTMGPWGLMRGDRSAEVRAQLRESATTGELRRFLLAAPSQIGGDFVQLSGEVVDGKLQVIASRADGSTQRLDADARPDPFSAATARHWLGRLDSRIGSFELLTAEDTYYYGHKEAVELPVYRAILDDAQRTRLYISPTTGSVRVIDDALKQNRWLVGAMHSLDLSGLRRRPVWDIVMLLLLAGVTALAITGAWMSLKRIRADFTPRD